MAVVQESSQSAVPCDACGDEYDCTWFCRNCPAYLCTVCKEKHFQDRLMKKHTLLPRTGSVLWTHGSWIVTEQCKKHKNSEISTFCNDCNKFVCRQCTDEHLSHSFLKLENKYFEAETRLYTFLNGLINVTMPELQRDVSILKQKIESCNDNFEEAKSEVESFFNDLIGTLERIRSEFVTELTKKQDQCRSNLSSHLNDSENEMQNIENIVSDVESRIKSGDLDLIKFYPKNPPVTSHSDITTPFPHFIFDADAITQVRKFIGKIVYDEDRFKCSKQSAVRDEVKACDFELEKMGSFRTDIKVRSIIPVDNNKAWLSYHFCETICLYENGMKVRSVTLKGSNGINDLAVQKSGDIIVSCRDDKVRRVSIDGQITILIETALFSCHGVCLTDKGEIVVSLTGIEKENHIALYTHDGSSLVRKISVRDENNKQLMTFPYRVFTFKSQIIALNLRENIVSVDQETGKLQWMYDGGKAKLDKKFCPAAICLDKFSNFLVPDDNNDCLHFIDNEGTLIKVIMTTDMGIKEPWGIGLHNQSGRIWCGSLYSDEVCVLNYKK